MSQQADIRQFTEIVSGTKTHDGAGVELTRMIGTADLPMLDPVLLFDVFGSDKPEAYIAGFPPHPHRGFETVTYMLAGSMRHQDSVGHNGVIEAGDVQWMTAGSGIIHSEMPEQKQGRLAGLQLWLNLPAEHKFTKPKYQEYVSTSFPVEQLTEGVKVTVISGQTERGTTGPIENHYTDPVFWLIEMEKNATFSSELKDGHNGFLYLVTGQLLSGETELNTGEMAILSQQGKLVFTATEASFVVLVSAKPMDEPVSRSGPFVMNTREQISQAYEDYRAGRLGSY